VPDYWTQRQFRAMGSHAHLIVGDAEPRLADWAVDEVERLEQCWSRFRPDSELNHLNAHRGEWVAIGPTLVRALATAEALWRLTDGVFDPTVLDALEWAGYDRSFELVDRHQPTPATEALPAPGFGRVVLDLGAGAVRLDDHTRLDLGGLGKGLAADLVAQGLVDRGARSALVSLGGDLRAAGEPPEGGWRIPVEDPFDERRVLAEHRLSDGAIVTSTRAFRTWQQGSASRHHIIDPATGRPATTDVQAVVAVGPGAALAEALAKTVMIVGAERGRDLLIRSGVTATVFSADGAGGALAPDGTASVPVL